MQGQGLRRPAAEAAQRGPKRAAPEGLAERTGARSAAGGLAQRLQAAVQSAQPPLRWPGLPCLLAPLSEWFLLQKVGKGGKNRLRPFRLHPQGRRQSRSVLVRERWERYWAPKTGPHTEDNGRSYSPSREEPINSADIGDTATARAWITYRSSHPMGRKNRSLTSSVRPGLHSQPKLQVVHQKRTNNNQHRGHHD
jgi:hypothetical protein